MIFTRLLLLHSLGSAHNLMSQESGETVFPHKHTTVQPATGDIAFAHHTLVAYKQNFCSGTLIGSRIVLTVASCFQHERTPYEIFVKLGFRNFLQEGRVISVIEKKEHEYFQYKSKLDNDIALLVLEKHVTFDSAVRKVVLWKPDFVVPISSTIVTTGWRKDLTQSQTHYLLQSEMVVINSQECGNTYPDVLTPSIFCARFELAKLLSDNGGAALYNGLVVGILLYGANVEDAPHIALFTNVTYFYKWIELNTASLLAKHCSQEIDSMTDAKHDLYI